MIKIEPFPEPGRYPLAHWVCDGRPTGRTACGTPLSASAVTVRNPPVGDVCLVCLDRLAGTDDCPICGSPLEASR